MSAIDRPRLALYVVLGVLVCVLGARWLRSHDVLPAAPPASAGIGPPSGRRAGPAAVRLEPRSRMVVDVAGAVRRPGVYRLRAGARVDDAIRRAGGVLPTGDRTAVNLAARIEDGRQIIVPERAPVAAGAAPAMPAGAPAAPPLNLNTATPEQLDTLDGIGPGLAQRILAYRREHGGFRNVDELGEVPGIGDKRLAGLKPRVRV